MYLKGVRRAPFVVLARDHRNLPQQPCRHGGSDAQRGGEAAEDSLRARRLGRLALGYLGLLERAVEQPFSAQANSSASIASPIGITTNAGPGVTSIAMPASVTVAPTIAKPMR